MGTFKTAQNEGKVIDYTPASAVSSGDVIFVGDLVGIAPSDIEANEVGALNVTGCYAGTKESTTDTFTYGSAVYYDSTNIRCTPTPTANYLGPCIEAATATDTTVKFRLENSASHDFDDFVEQDIVFGNFNDNGDATGYVDLSTAIPAASQVTGWKITTSAGFTGDTTATAQVGVNGDLDRFSAVTSGSVLATGTIGCQAGTANDFCAAATTVRLTITGGADFTSINAGALNIRVYYKSRQ